MAKIYAVFNTCLWDINASQNILAQVLRELNLKGGRNYRLKPRELLPVGKALNEEAFGSLA